MDVLFILTGLLCGIEAVMLFAGRDYIMFRGGRQKEEDYDTEKLYRAERWNFVIDAVLLLVIGIADEYIMLSLACIGAALVTLAFHLRNFSRYRKDAKKNISGNSRMKTK